MNDAATVIDIYTQVTDQTEPGATSATKTVSKLEKAMQKMQSEITKLRKMSKIEVVMYAMDKASHGIDALFRKGRSIAGKVWTVTLKAVDLVTAPFRGIMRLLANPIVAAAGVAGIGFGATDLINTYKGFEKQMSAVGATAMASPEEQAKLTDQAKKLGADTAYSATEAAYAMENLASAGFTVDEIISSMPGLLDLAASSGEDLARSAEIASNALRAFNLDASESGRVADVFAQAAASTNASVASMGEAMDYIAPGANAARISLENTAAAIGALANSGITGSSAGTALQAILTSLTERSGNASKLMKKLGMEFYNADGTAKDFTGIVAETEKALAGMSDQQRASTLDTIFGTQASKAMNVLLSRGSEKLGQLTTDLENSSGAAKKMADIRMDNLAGSFEELSGSIETVKIEAMEKLAPHLRKFVDWVKEKVPDISRVVGRAVDNAADRIKRFGSKISEITNMPEFQGASFFGKVKILWDEIIAKPFSNWWNNKGREWMNSVANQIGRGIGGAIKWGVTALFGLEGSDAIKDGLNIGKSFADGFSKGIEGIDWGKVTKGIIDGLKKVLELLYSNPVTGTMATVFFGGKAFGAVSGGYKAVKSVKNIAAMLFGGSTVTDGVASASNAIFPGIAKGLALRKAVATGDTAAQAAFASARGGQMGIGAKVGAAGAGGMVLGAAGVAGGIIAVGGLVDATTDFVRGLKATDKRESAAYKESAAWKAGGVAAGAAIGTLILPGIGTAIGAGIGYLGGKLIADTRMKEYEEEMKQAEEAARKLQIQQEQAKYSSSNLKKAVADLADGYITAYEFMEIRQAEVTRSMQKRFGNVNLSMSDIQNIADRISFGSMKDGMVAFAEATARANSALGQLQGTSAEVERLVWKLSLGFDYNPEDNKALIESFIADAKEYVESRHFEITMATRLLRGDSYDLTSFNEIMKGYQDEINDLGIKLTLETDLEDPDPAKISDYRTKIMEIIKKLEQDEQQSKIDLYGAILGGSSLSNLSLEDFNTVWSKFEENRQLAKENILDAQSAAAVGLKLKLENGIINKREYLDGLEELATSAAEELAGVDKNIVDSLVGGMADAFGLESSELMAGMQESLKAGIDPANWTSAQAASFIGLTDLEAEAVAGLGEMASRLAAQFPGIFGVLGTPQLYGPTQYHGPVIEPEGQDTQKPDIPSSAAASGLANGGIFGAYANGSIIDFNALRPISTFTDSRGVMSAPHIGLVGEDGPEAIIPLSSNRRQRGLSLWERAGRILGANPYADGAITSTPSEAISSGTGGGYITVPVTIDSVTFDVTIDSTAAADTDSIVKVLKDNIKNLTDEIARSLAQSLQQVFANIPTVA